MIALVDCCIVLTNHDAITARYLSKIKTRKTFRHRLHRSNQWPCHNLARKLKWRRYESGEYV